MVLSRVGHDSKLMHLPVVAPLVRSRELPRRLIERCPLVFRGWSGLDDSVPPLSRDIACGPGWDALVEVLCEALEEEAWQRVRAGMPVRLAPATLQIKERLGALRVHLYHQAAWTEALVEVAAQRSSALCTCCGAEVLRQTGYNITQPARCGRHWQV